MRLLKTLLIAAISVGLFAASANATVSVTHTNDTGGATILFGETFNVDVTVGYDGTPILTGVFVSAMWDTTVLKLTGSTAAPFAENRK